MRPVPHALAFLDALHHRNDFQDPGVKKVRIPVPILEHPPLGSVLTMIVPERDLPLVRFHAIKRIIDPLFGRTIDASKISSQVVIELIRSGYLDNDSFPEAGIEAIARAVLRGGLLLDSLPEQRRYRGHVVAIVTCEILGILYPLAREAHAVTLAFSTLRSQVELGSIEGSVNARDMALFIATWRGLYAWNDAFLFGRLYPLYAPQYEQVQERSAMVPLAEQFPAIDSALFALLESTLPDRITPVIQDIVTGVAVLYDVCVTVPQDVLRQFADRGEVLDAELRSLLTRRYTDVVTRARQSANHASIFLLVLGGVSVVFLQIPSLLISQGNFLFLPLLFSVLVPPLWLMLLAGRIGSPNVVNTNRISSLVHDLVFGDPRPTAVRVPSDAIMSRLDVVLLSTIGMLFFVFFAFVVILSDMKGLTASAFACSFLIASILGLRIRFLADRLTLFALRPDPSERFVRFLFAPFVVLGRWLLRRVDRFPVAVVVLDSVLLLSGERIMQTFFDLLSFVRHGNQQE